MHVLRLRSGQQGGGGGQSGVKAVGAGASLSLSPTAGGSGNGRRCDDASSPPASVDGSTQGLDGGYVVFIEKKKSASASCVLFLSLFLPSFLPSFLSFSFFIIVHARLLNRVGLF